MEAEMADEHFVVMTVECQHCKTKQKVHIAASTDGAQVGGPDDSMHQLQQSFQGNDP
jgi:hypothetical protein